MNSRRVVGCARLTLATILLAACQVELDEPFIGRACDDDHPCAEPTRCEEGVCLVPTDGVLGAWAPGGTVMPPRQLGAAAATNGFLYLAGGCTAGTLGSSCAVLADVQVGTLGTAGEVTRWSTANPLPAPRAGMGMVAVNGFLYVLGGNDGSATRDQVWVASLAEDGSPSEWRSTTPLPKALVSHSALAYRGRLYVAGGNSPAGGFSGEVYVGDLAADGAVSSWRVAGTFAPARVDFGFVASGGWLHVVGGWYASRAQDDLLSAQVQSDGTLGDFQSAGNLPHPLAGAATGVVRAHLVVTGGVDASGVTAETWVAPLAPSGQVGPFTGGPALSPPRFRSAAATVGQALFVLTGARDDDNLATSMLGEVIRIDLR